MLGAMLDGYKIQSATLDDLPELAELLFDLFTHESDFIPDQAKQMRGLKLILEEPSRGRIFILRHGPCIIGMINLLITISTAEGGFVLILEDLVIHRDHRGHGYGGRLLEYALEYARKKHFLRVTLLTDFTEKQARKFYAHYGFEESDMILMRLRFSDKK
jgi:GNAT superfamily N-acetyltransferase